MIKRIIGKNILDSTTQAIVNTVNTVGVMGKGLALQFKIKYPDNFREYKKICNSGKFTTGMVVTFDLNTIDNPQYIINFPTKQHWMNNSRMEYIETGLQALVKEITKLQIESISIPPLGCGLGGLNWNEVYPKIEEYLGNLKNIEILVFEPN